MSRLHHPRRRQTFPRAAAVVDSTEAVAGEASSTEDGSSLATSAEGPLEPGRINRLRRAGWPLIVTLCALLLLLAAGRSLLQFTPLSSSSVGSPSRTGTSPSPATAQSHRNSLSSLAADYYAAYSGKPISSLPARHLTPARFGTLQTPPIAPVAIIASPFAAALASPELPAYSSVSAAFAPQPRAISHLPPLSDAHYFSIGERLALGALPAQRITASDEALARVRADDFQQVSLNGFLQVSRARERATLRADATAAKRSIEDEMISAVRVDLGPLSPELPDARTQLEMTNLRLKLSPALSLAPGEREAAQKRLAQLEADWAARFAAQREVRNQELARLRDELPRQVRQKGLAQLSAQQAAALTRSAQARAQAAAPLRDALQQDAVQSPLRITLPTTKAAPLTKTFSVKRSER